MILRKGHNLYKLSIYTEDKLIVEYYSREANIHSIISDYLSDKRTLVYICKDNIRNTYYPSTKITKIDLEGVYREKDTK